MCLSVSVFVKDSSKSKIEQDRVSENERGGWGRRGDVTTAQTKAASVSSELSDRDSPRCSLADGQVA